MSDLAHVDRVQGLTLGFGLTVQAAAAAHRASSLCGLRHQRRPPGRAPGRPTSGSGPTTLTLGAGRRVQDVSDFLITAPVVNSITSQEVGQDYGDYALVDWVQAGLRQPVADRTSLALGGGPRDVARHGRGRDAGAWHLPAQPRPRGGAVHRGARSG